MICLKQHHKERFIWCVLQLIFAFCLFSSVSAGCRGGVLMCAISSFTCRMKVKLFEALTKQEIGFFETIKTGKALIHVNNRKHVMLPCNKMASCQGCAFAH